MKTFFKKHKYLRNFFLLFTPIFSVLGLIKDSKVSMWTVLWASIFCAWIFATLIWSTSNIKKDAKHKIRNHKHYWRVSTKQYNSEGRIFLMCYHCHATIEIRPWGKDKMEYGYWRNKDNTPMKRKGMIDFYTGDKNA